MTGVAVQELSEQERVLLLVALSSLAAGFFPEAPPVELGEDVIAYMRENFNRYSRELNLRDPADIAKQMGDLMRRLKV